MAVVEKPDCKVEDFEPPPHEEVPLEHWADLPNATPPAYHVQVHITSESSYGEEKNLEARHSAQGEEQPRHPSQDEEGTAPAGALKKPSEQRRREYGNYALGAFFFVSFWFMNFLLGILSLTFWWKGSIDFGAHLTTIAAFVLVTWIPCFGSCCCCSCCRKPLRENRLARSKFWRCIFISAPLTGWITLTVVFIVLYHSDFTPALNAVFDASQPVAIVGSGPSGLTAAWALAKSGRRVVLVEALSEIGGHSRTWDEPMPDGSNASYDIGFIFNNPAYEEYKQIAQYLNYSLTNTSLNVSGSWNNRYWDNTNAERGVYPDELEDDIDKFQELVKQPPSVARFLLPLGTLLWWHGFSEAFLKLCLESTMKVLFVTKMGLLRQSSQAVLTFFDDGGFTHLRASPPKVQNNLKGSQHMWRDFLKDMMSTGRVQVHLDSEVVGMRQDNGVWSLQLSHGNELTGFGDVVLALPAEVQKKLVHDPFQQILLSQIDYIPTYLSLHTHASATTGKAAFASANEDVVYFVDDVSMTGKVSKIFGSPSTDLLLTVHEDKDLIPQNKIKSQHLWSHHYFSMWELAVAHKIVPLFFPANRVHLAGDWIYGVGHNDAIKSGIAAACSVGMPKTLPESEDSRAQQLFHYFIKYTCTPGLQVDADFTIQ
eukprot:TRINITY_DN88716_c0_g1_i1.p1 TRINITY_DN88716_c0_g1~~TRINITY_DN88716_c0_g1_i1.p1  ORF type:complete len:668 (-),score=116.87 TRINITY_DN88716_c0_g1_i1:91-2049(-)